MKKEATAIIYSCEYTYGGGARGGKRWISTGAYSVNLKTYYYRVEAVVPLGVKFKIYYLPSQPQKALLADPHQFDDYPKYKKMK